MRNLNNKKTNIAICALAIILIIGFNWKALQIKWVEVFRLNATFADYDKQGNANGKLLIYKAGKIYVIGNIDNGVKQGWETMFHVNGKVKSRTYFVDGRPSGKGYIYTSEGKLRYSGNYFNGKPCGGWYEYFDNGEPKKFSLFDFNKEVSFGVNYARDGGIQLKSMSGFVVSSVFYSFDAKVDSLVPMDYAINSDRKFSNISDLYITVANAKDTRLSVLVKINERKYRVDSVKSSVLKIDNAFSRNCKYDIFIESHLYDSNNNEINGINIKDSIIKIN